MDRNAICTKTEKGLDELTHRTYKLGFRMRQVLFMVDGSKSAGFITDNLAGDVAAMMAELLAGGFIAISGAAPATAAAPPPRPAAPPAPAAPAAPGAGTTVSREAFERAQSFMVNTARMYGGVFASRLIDRLEACDDAAGLRALTDEWYVAINGSRDGKRDAPDLLRKLRTTLN
ncbi:MAG: hypothetical protein KF778_10775 [Rhodocyclaceae bacterium]|nr:hypothetical protein [Rhodocyclaceae bacterium]MBX3668876.1 hypothetical protein [Rhodocyclaceae bacterium]